MAARIMNSIDYREIIRTMIQEENRVYDDVNDDLEIDIEEGNENVNNENKFYYNAIDIFRGNIDSKVNSLKNLILEIDRLSWNLFEYNKTFGANCIDIYSPKVARIFDMANTITDNIKFNTNNQYINKNTYFLGELNGKYKVFMPKKATRIVLSEKTLNNNLCSEKFIDEKRNLIEIYNSEMPKNKFIINLENIQ